MTNLLRGVSCWVLPCSSVFFFFFFFFFFFTGSFSILITSFGVEKAGLYASRACVCFVCTRWFFFFVLFFFYWCQESGSFRPLSRSPLSRFAHFPFRPESFRPRVVSPTFPFAPESFRPLPRSPLSRFAPLWNFISRIIISALKVV